MSPCRAKSKAFSATSTCGECPWRKDVPTGRFPPERFEALRSSVTQGVGEKMFGCHKSPEGEEFACVGYLMSKESLNNFQVRIALAQGRFDPDKLRAKAPLYESFEAMLRANGARGPGGRK